jgi:hypothetical protein
LQVPFGRWITHIVTTIADERFSRTTARWQCVDQPAVLGRTVICPKPDHGARADTAQQREEIEMLSNRRQRGAVTTSTQAFDGFHEWVLSLPWIVERPYALATPGVRCFDVDCPPLGRRQKWMLTGFRSVDPSGLGLAVIVPVEAARYLEDLGWGRTVAPMPTRHALVTVDDQYVAYRDELEAVVLATYDYTLS